MLIHRKAKWFNFNPLAPTRRTYAPVRSALARLLVCVFWFFGGQWIGAQTLPDFVQQAIAAQDSVRQDSVPPVVSSRPTGPAVGGNLDSITVSDDALDDKIDYEAKDSMRYDLANKEIHLFGNAKVTYTDLSITANHIVFNYDNNIVTAEGYVDSSGTVGGFPEFSDGTQTFGSNRMRYNFKERRGLIFDARTQFEDIFVQGGSSKFLSADPDDTLSQTVVFNRNAVFTTCDLDHPHFGVRSRKQKLIGDNMVVIGGSNVELMGIPTPLFLPFGFFPLGKTKSTGLLFPQDYEYSEQWGFGLRGIGWYFPINDYLDLQLKGDIYFNGSWGIDGLARYNKRYKYTGSFAMGYARRRSERVINREVVPQIQPSFFVRWSHNQDRKAHPNRTFGGSVNIQTNNYQSLNNNTAQAVLAGTLSSNISYRQQFPGLPFNYSASLNHSQNTQTGEVRISFPNFNFQTQTLYPFKRRKVVGKEKWYEQITLRYNADVKNTITTTDSTLFDRETIENMRFGIQQRADAGTSFKLFRYFNLNPSVRYREVTYLDRDEQFFDPTLLIQDDTIFDPDDPEVFRIEPDTLQFGNVQDTVIRGLTGFREYSASLSLNTQIFGTIQFKKGWLRGVRHVIKPNISLNYAPNYLDPERGYFGFVQTDTRFGAEEDFERYNFFSRGIFGSPSASKQQFAVGYSIANLFEAKLFSKRDSTEKKLRLFRSFNISGNYNIAADSLKWSGVRVSATSTFFNGITTANFRMALDPYQLGENGRRIDRFHFRATGNLLRFDNATLGIATRLTVRKIRDLLKGKNSNDLMPSGSAGSAPAPPRGSGGPASTPVGPTNLLDMFDRFSINHNFNLSVRPIDGTTRDTLIVSANTVNMRGNIELTPNWSVTVGNIGYDFISKRLTYPDLGFTRNLHCWEMTFRYQPQRGTYFFTVRARSPKFSFLKVPYQRNNADAFSGF